MYKKGIKRILDFLIALVSLIVLSPLFLVLSLLVRFKLGSPVLFQQKRPGYQEKIFTLYKFRSMNNQKDSQGNLLPDDQRLTSFGKFLRASSLDELPELVNVLKGDMALVGPRPQLVKDMVFMTSTQRQRHSVRPGLTGLAQVNGRNTISWEQKMEYDLQYIQKITFLKDCSIIGKTIGKVFCHSDIHAEGMATAMDLGDYLLSEGRINQQEYMARQEEANALIEATK